MKQTMKKFWWLVASLLAVWAPGMDMRVQRVLRPDATELGGYLYQAVGRTFDAIQTDSITLVFMMAGVLWLTRRYLYHKPKNTGLGEYLLCGFFTVMQLLNTAKRHADTVSVLYANMFQLIKVLLYLPGMFVLLLCAIRALNELLSWRSRMRGVSLWDKHPFLFCFVVILLLWLPVLIIRYPGAITIDTALQHRQFMLWDERTTPHPPFGTLFYGLLLNRARNSMHINLVYFAWTLLKTFGFIAVLSYALLAMRRYRVPMWVQWLSLALFAISPIYSGWTVVICKDSEYLILCLLIGVLMIEHIAGARIWFSRWKMALMGVSLTLLMLVRHNGVLIAVPLLLALLGGMMYEKLGRKNCLRFFCFACAVMLCSFGIKECIIRTMGFKKESQDDWMSLMFMQTARLVTLHGDELPQEERDELNKMFRYDWIPGRYDASQADRTRWNVPEDGERSPEDVRAYVKTWWQQFKRYPVVYLDAVLHMNGVLFDLQDNAPMYVALTDHFNTDHVYHDSFNDMDYYNANEIRPLSGYQYALTEYFYRFSELPLVGQFASMGFCMEVMLSMAYLCCVSGKKRLLYVMLPALAVGANGLLCAVVYLRYLVPMVASLPLWLGGWFACSCHEDENEGGTTA